MNGQNFGEKYSTSNFVERPERDANSPLAHPDSFGDEAPFSAGSAQQTQAGAAVGQMDDPLVNENQYAAPVKEAPVYDAPKDDAMVVDAVSRPSEPVANLESASALLDREVSEHLRVRWNEIQGKFVDEPRSAVQQADVLVTEVIEKITQMFTSEHTVLEGQWKQGSDVSTEDLRKALQRYRSFFNRLVV